MTAEYLAKYRNDHNMPFWKNLKQGSDHFEITKREPRVSVCNGRYAFNTVGNGCQDDPTLAPTVAQKESQDNQQIAALVAGGTPSVRVQYSDGSGHDGFRTGQLSTPATVSRPEAFAQGGQEIAMDASPKASGKPARASLAALTTAGIGKPGDAPGRTRVASADAEGAVLAARHPKGPAKADKAKAGQ